MPFASWLRRLPWVAARTAKPAKTVVRKRQRAATVRKRFIPQLEHLETRLAPASFTVTNLNDTGVSGDGSLRGEILAAETAGSGNTVNFTAGLSGTINLSGSAFGFTKSITIDGSGATISVSGQNLIQVFNVGVTATIDNLSIIDGKAVRGGGIEVITGGNLTLTDVTISNCSATTGGAIYLKTGTLNVVDSTFSSNTASSSGGVIYANAGTFTASESTFSDNHATARSGGAVYSYHATTTLTNDTFSGNTSGTFGGAVYNHSTLTLTDDTLSGNTSAHQGGGLANLMTGGPTATVTDVTFYDNTAKTGGAIYQQSGGNLHLVSDTIAGNPASSQGGGLYINGGNVTTFNSILDGNTATKGPDVYLSAGTFTSSGGNLYGNTSGVTWKTISTVGALYPDVHDAADNPKLNSLAPNGGYTQTMAPLSGSPALGAGNPVTNTLATDQRGFLRVVNNKIDIGAYENQNQFFTLSPPSSNNVGANSWNLGSFSEAPSLSNWSVSVSWGDGATTSFTTSSQGSLGTRTHYYASATNYTITVTITDADGNFSSMSFGVTGGPLVVNTLNELSHAVGYPIPTSPLDSKGNISLRSALDYVNYYNLPGTIDFTSGLSGTIGLTNALHNLQITDTNSLTIDGTGASITVSGAGLSGISRGGVFFINTTSSVTINDLAIIDGTSSAEGGGIYHSNGNLTLTNDTIESNTATNNSGGGIYSDGGTLTLRNDTIASNVAKNNGADGGGVCSTGGNLTVTNCSVVHNTASGSGGGIAFVEVGSITLTDDTIADNSAGGAGGGVFLSLTGGGSANFTNITITGNSAATGGGIYNSYCVLTLDTSTLNDNAATSTGGGIYSTGTGGSLTTFNSILDGNTKTSGGIFVSYSDVYLAGGTFTSSGRNLYGKTASNVTWNTTGSFQDVPDPNDNPNLGALQNNGGTTQTMAELPGSLAFQAGLLKGQFGTTPPTTDQRGFSRTSTIGTNTYIDIGAFQNQSQLFTVNSAASEPNPTVGQSTAFNLGSFSYTGSAINLWTVTVNWGDGTSSTFTTTNQGNLGTLNHTYATLGNNKTFTVFVADANGNFGQATSPTFNIVPPTSIGTNTIAVVTTTLDLSAVNPSLSPLTTNGNVSLRSALQYANTNNLAGTIYFQAGLTGINDIGSTGGTYLISDISGLGIDASGANFTVNGDNMVQDFFVNPGTLVAIKNLSIIDGNNPSGSGGGVYNAGNLTLDNDTISGNSANKNGGAVYLYTKGNLTLNNDILSGNKATNSGGAVYNDSASLTLANDILSGNKAGNSGGAIYNSAGNLTVTGGAVTGNKATDGGGGGIYFFGGTETISDTTVANNAALSYFGGGIYNSSGNVTLTNDTISGNTTSDFSGGGIFNYNGPMVITNSTIAGNSAANSGGGIANTSGNLTLANDTIADNKGDRNGGVFNGTTGNVTIISSIVDGNAGFSVYNQNGNVVSSGGNLFGPTSGGISVGPGDQFDDFNNPLLGGLQNNGGPTQTLAELPDSPALGKGSLTKAPATDQRGFPRVVYHAIDSGAFEDQNQLFVMTPPTAAAVDAGQPATINLGSFTYSGNAGNVWTVDVNWGDNTADTVFTVTRQGSLGTQNHTYASTSGSPYTITISVADAQGNFGQTTGSVNVSRALAITTASIPAGVVNAPYPQTQFTVSGGNGPYTFRSTGNLDGLNLSSGGLFTGRPTGPGSFPLTVAATDANGGTASQTYTLVVSPALVLTVNTTADTDAADSTSSPQDSSGNISLRSALEYVNANNVAGTINFVPGLTGTINLTKGNLQVTDSSNLTIDATGAAVTVSGAGLAGIAEGGVFYIGNGATDAIRFFTITGGTATSGGGVYDGSSGSLTLSNVTLTKNAATSGGGIFCASGGNVALTNDTVTGNTATNGAGIDDDGSNVTLTNVLVASNIATGKGGGISAPGAEGSLTVVNSTIAGNSAKSGGGLYDSLYMVITNSTVASNSAMSTGGGIYNFGGYATIASTTIAYNSASTAGGGIYNTDSPITTGSVYVVNSIVDGNSVRGSGSDVVNTNGNTFSSTGGNLFGAVAGTVSGPGYKDQYDNSDNPGLGLLQNNGGPTPTLAELLGSLALKAGITQTSGGVFLSLPSTDQRGSVRTVGSKLDVGAFENQSQFFMQTPPPAATVDAGQSFAFNLGSFTYSGNAGVAWTVDVSWGDNTPDTVFTVARQGSLGTQNHTYANPTSGTPYTIRISVTDANGNFGQASSSVAVDSAITITSNPAKSPAGLVGSNYNGGTGVTFTASGGSGKFTGYSVSGNTDGLTLTGNTLGGKPTDPGTFTFTVAATDSNGGTGSQTYTLLVYPALSVVTTSLPNATVGNAYNEQIVAVGGSGGYQLSTTSPLPAGMKLNPSGFLAGTPTSAAGSPFNITVTVTDSNGDTYTTVSPLALAINPAITVSSNPFPLPTGLVGVGYNGGSGVTFAASGGSGSYTGYTVSGDTDNLNLTGNQLAGTPAYPGTFTFTITATDTNGATGSQTYNLVVYSALSISPTSLPAGTAGSHYTQLLSANGGSGGYTFTVSSGNAPTGLTLSPNGLLSGTPTSTNGGMPFAFTVKVTDSNSDSVTQNFSVTISPSAPAHVSATTGSGQIALVTAAFATNLAATVTDAYGNPVPGVTVTFAAPTSGPSGTFAGSTSVTTNAGGVAAAPSYTADTLAGGYAVTASVTGGGVPASFGLTNLPPAAIGTGPNATFIENVYALLLNRVADAGAAYWVNQLDSGMPAPVVVQAVEASTEYLDDMVTAVYRHYLNRAPDAGGLAYWSSQIAGGTTIESATATILSSAEYFTDNGGTNTGFVVGLYKDVLGRGALPSEVQGWVNALNVGAMRNQIALSFLTSLEYRIDLLNGGPWVAYNPLTNWGGYYPEFLRRPADAGGLVGWTQAFQAGLSDEYILAAIFGSPEGYAKWS